MAGALVRRLMPHSVGTDEIEKFISDLEAVKAEIEEADERQEKKIRIIQWLNELRDLRCDMEDVLDEWNTGLLKSKIAAKEEDGSSNKVRFGSCFCSSHVDRVGQRRHIALKMKDLTKRLHSIAELRLGSRLSIRLREVTRVDVRERETDSLDAIVSVYGRGGDLAPTTDSSDDISSVPSVFGGEGLPMAPTTDSFLDISSVYGREGDRDNIVKTLLSESMAVPDVVAIVGMGGLGKTTLAQLAYNDRKVFAHFDLRMWVCRVEPFLWQRIALAILEAISGERQDPVDLDSLSSRIRDSIAGKKFLLVLDDVWNENSSRWELLKQSLCYGAVGSKILVTTRNMNVARMMATTPVITLGALSEEDSWFLFRNIAYWSMDEINRKQFEDIGRKIASKCKGMPLALKTLGDLLRSKRTGKDWLRVLNSELWEFEEVSSGILAPLRLSYYDLVASVRRCFSYCAIFPKDYMIETDSLIKMWMSQGFLDSDSGIEKELLGQRYFMDLASRSFFQEFEKDYRGNIIRCKMHDLVHDLAQSVTEHECFLIEVSGATQDMKRVLEKPRHGTFVLAAGATFPISTCNEKTLRTAFFLCSTNTAITHDVFVPLKCLRTLNLSDFWFKELPKEIGKFVHLRYLNLSGNDELKILPETLCELSNLQTLLVSKCMQLEKLPDHMEKLISLRHLHVDGSFNLLTLPKGIAKLTSLRTLDMLVVPLSDNLEAFQLEDMKRLNNVEGYLRICRCGNLRNVHEAENAQLFCRRQIVDLNLDFSWSQGRRLKDEIVLEALRPQPNLESLEIRKYRGTAISPHWLMWLNNLRRLALYSCQYCESLPPLGKLASLESLKICLMKGVKKVGLEFLGIETDGVEKSSFVSFPKLRELCFTELSNWKVWEGSVGFTEEHDSTAIMPLLNSLEIDSCFFLQVLPDFLKMTKLQNLTVTECEILQEHCKEGTGKEWVKISHIPIVKFLNF